MAAARQTARSSSRARGSTAHGCRAPPRAGAATPTATAGGSARHTGIPCTSPGATAGSSSSSSRRHPWWWWPPRTPLPSAGMECTSTRCTIWRTSCWRRRTLPPIAGRQRRALPFLELAGRAWVALDRRHGAQVAVDRAKVLVAHPRERLPRHVRPRVDTARPESRHELILRPALDAPRARVGSEIRRDEHARRVLVVRQLATAGQQCSGIGAGQWAARGVAARALRDVHHEVLATLDRATRRRVSRRRTLGSL